MVSKNISFNYKNKKIKLSTRKCGLFNFGLMFRTKKTKPCLFEFNQPQTFKLTSLFVFFDFIVVWLENNKIVDIKKIKPFTFSFSSQKAFTRIVEIPINGEYKKILEILVGDRKI